jgi:hypothetical protein
MRLGGPHRPGLWGPLGPGRSGPSCTLSPHGASLCSALCHSYKASLGLHSVTPRHSGPFFLAGPALLETLGWSQPVLCTLSLPEEPACAHVETDTQSSLPPRAMSRLHIWLYQAWQGEVNGRWMPRPMQVASPIRPSGNRRRSYRYLLPAALYIKFLFPVYDFSVY